MKFSVPRFAHAEMTERTSLPTDPTSGVCRLLLYDSLCAGRYPVPPEPCIYNRRVVADESDAFSDIVTESLLS